MSSLGSPNPFFIAGKKAYEVERSLRFNPADITNLERTFSSAGNRRTWTFSFWYKRSGIGRNTDLFGSKYGGDGANENRIYFQDNDQLRIYDSGGISGYPIVRTAAKFRDVGAWYHFVVAVDTTQSTASNRVKIYANNVLQELDETTYGNQNQQLGWNNNLRHRVGAYGNADSLGTSNINSGYMAEVNFIDGFQYDPSYFGETNAITGQWNPKKYTGSYGTNGFYLNFSDNSGTTATTLGKDSSGNGNNFTPNNFSVSAGIGNDSLEDTPTNNFPTLNPLDVLSGGNTRSLTISEGNLKVAVGSGGEGNVNMTTVANIEIPTSGKWYWEVHVTDVATASASRTHLGIINQAAKFDDGLDLMYADVAGVYAYAADGTKAVSPSGTMTSYGASYTDNDIIGFAVDSDNGSIAFYKNGASQGTAFTGLDMSEGFMPVVGYWGTFNINFGQRAFDYTVPTGYKNLRSANLPDPTILLPTKHFGTITYSGNSSTQVITDTNEVDFTPDWVWVKRRNGSNSHILTDSVRGVHKYLGSFDSGAEAENSIYLTAFNSGGFTSGNNGDMNVSGRTYVAWNWNAGDTDGKTYTVTVVDDSGNKFRFDGFAANAVTLDLAEGGTYIFNYPSGHPFRFSTTADGTHGGGSEYTTGVTHNSSTQVTIVVAASAPTLYYYCSSHSGMGGQVNTNSTSGSSNFDGAIQTTVKVNASAGFSIATYTGTESNTTFGHGLGVAPQAAFFKRRNSSGNWMVYHQGLGNTHNLYLNTSDTSQDDSHAFNDTSPTSSVFTLGISGFLNANGGTYVAYVFSEVAGYSKFGSYTGNGSADGAFIFLGFRPSLVIAKRTDSTGYWRILDNKRDPHNVAHHALFANTNDTESDVDGNTQYNTDFYSNGFKLRTTLASSNASGGTWIYLAFAESPFKNARAR